LPTLLSRPAGLGEHTDRFLIARLRMPVLIVWVSATRFTPLAQGTHLAQLIPGATLSALKDVGHIPQIEDTAQFNDVLVKFLAERKQTTLK